MLRNKIDLLSYVDFDVERCIQYARQLSPAIQFIKLSAAKGDNFSDWTDWLAQRIKSAS